MLNKSSLSSVEKRIEELEKQMRQALCDHPQDFMQYMNRYNDGRANPEYEKYCGLCEKPFGNVLESDMHRDIAKAAQEKADKHNAAAAYIEDNQ